MGAQRVNYIVRISGTYHTVSNIASEHEVLYLFNMEDQLGCLVLFRISGISLCTTLVKVIGAE